jgi:hypothetical protein
MRQRLSWTEKKADPYTMNQQHANNPVEKYKTYDTSAGGEDPDMRRPWEQEGRTETGHPAPAAEPVAAPAPMAPVAPEATPEAEPVTARDAVMAARKMEDKALKCITIAQRMLPGATDDLIELQATDLMYMPERCILATLSRQSELAQKLAAEEVEEEKEEEKEEAPANEEAPAKEKVKPEEVKACDTPAAVAAPAAAPVEDVKPEEKKAEEVAVAPVKEEEKEEAAAVKTASDSDLLDMLFSDEPKVGAKKLSGIVKQASSHEGDLTNLWDSPPDVSKAFR